MRDVGSEDLWVSSAIGARLMAGWACAAVGALNLSMGLDPSPYLIFHTVLLAGGLLLLTMGKLPKTPGPIGYAVTAALAVLALVLAALPPTSIACCLGGLAVRHGYPLTILAWDAGQKRHFAPAYVVADLVFWSLAGLILLVAVTLVLPRRAVIAGPEPDWRPTGGPTHAEEQAGAEGRARAADDESVRGLP